MNLFGAGYLVGRPAATAANPLPTPRTFGQLQEVSFDDAFEVKQLFGPNSRPLREFRGQAKTQIKAKFAQISGRQFAEIFWGITETAGATIPVFGELQTIPGTTGPVATMTFVQGGTSGWTTASALPTTTSGAGTGMTINITASGGIVTSGTVQATGSGYAVGDKIYPVQGGSVGICYFTVATITVGAYAVTANNAGTLGANFVEDYGPRYAATGNPFTLVTASPAQGQYMLGSGSSSGQYTFSSADNGAQIVLNYSYKNSATGFTVNVPNMVQGEAPYFECVLTNPTDGGFVRRVYKCAAPKIAQNFKQGDIMIPELDINVYDPGTGVVWTDSYAGE